MNTLHGKILCEVKENKKGKNSDKEAKKLKKNETAFYFTQDKLIFRKEDNSIINTIEPFTIKWIRNNVDDIFSFFEYFKYRLKAFVRIVGGPYPTHAGYPFYFTGLNKEGAIGEPVLLEDTDSYFAFLKFDKDSIKQSRDDIKLLDKKIPEGSKLESAMIWFVFGIQSETKSEEFMNYYRCIELLALDYYDEIKNILNDSIDKCVPPSFRDLKKQIKVVDSYKIRKFLEKNMVEKRFINRIISIRNSKIAHGHDIKMQFNTDLTKVNEHLKELCYKLIIKEINRKVSGFKTDKLLVHYYVYENYLDSTKKIIEVDQFNYFKNGPEKKRFSTLNYWTQDEIKNIIKKMNLSKIMEENIIHYHELSISPSWKLKREIYLNMKT